jgi:sugar phosphate isomerase/epimerase
MDCRYRFTRRSFLATTGVAVAASVAAKGKHVPVGLELYSVRDEMKKDLLGTVRRVGQMGYEGVEFYSPYFEWTPEYAKEVRKVLDEVKLKCWSTHNGAKSFDAANIQKAIDLNGILGSKYVVMASAGKVEGLDGWKKVAEILTEGQTKLKTAGMKAGYHNHQTEFKPIDGKRPMEVLAANTPKDVMLQLDVGTCIEVGSDPVAWIKANPGRINSLHCKEWTKEKATGFCLERALFRGKRSSPPQKRPVGLSLTTSNRKDTICLRSRLLRKCLANFKKIRAS